jgi:uncharacterized protein YukE
MSGSMEYTADLERLASHVESARAFVDGLERTATRLLASVSTLHLTWSGRAAEAHRTAHDQWARGERELREALAAMAGAADRAQEHYRAAALANEEMWRPLG